MTTLYRHRIYCNTIGGWAYLWKDNQTPLTVCPDDPTHSAQAGSASIIEVQDPGKVSITKEFGFTTKGRPRIDSYPLDIPAAVGLVPGTATLTITWPIDIAIYTTRVYTPSASAGCSYTLDVAPRTPAGVLPGGAELGATTFQASPIALTGVDLGMIITLSDNGSPIQELGRAIAIDRLTGMITVETATATAFAPGTLLLCGARPADALELPPGLTAYGEDRTIAIFNPKGRPLVATVANPTASPVHIISYVSYTY